jgi:hypothetical protein
MGAPVTANGFMAFFRFDRAGAVVLAALGLPLTIGRYSSLVASIIGLD